MFCETTQRSIAVYLQINLQYQPADGLNVTSHHHMEKTDAGLVASESEK